jgi:hypothetical protein
VRSLRRSAFGPVLVAVVIGGSAASAPAAPVARAALPVLRLAPTHPVTVRGSNFKAGERVALTVISGKTWATHAAANAGGTFTVKLPPTLPASCKPYSIRAAGAAGSKARLAGKAACPTADVVFATSSVQAKGSGFKPGERLIVKLDAEHSATKTTIATAKGTFLVDLGALTLNSCNQYTLTVTGSYGSRFTLDHPTAPC